MKKYPKWRIGIAVTQYFTVDLEAVDEEHACLTALTEVHEDPEYWHTGYNEAITGVFINDAQTRGFAEYVPEHTRDYTME